MEITERIEACITELDERRAKMASFEARVRAVIATLRNPGDAAGAIGEALAVLEGVLEKYGEIDLNCRRMIEGLREIGEHLDRIEDGRQKIVEGVERILSHLAQLDEMANKGVVLGSPAEKGPDGKAKRVLVIRIRPDEKPGWSGGKREEKAEEDGLDLLDADSSVIH